MAMKALVYGKLKRAVPLQPLRIVCYPQSTMTPFSIRVTNIALLLTLSLTRGRHPTRLWSPSTVGRGSERFSKLKMRGAGLAIPGVIDARLMKKEACTEVLMGAASAAQ